MQENKMNPNEPLNDKQLENVTGAETLIIIHPYPEIKVTCKCGHSFHAPYNVAGKYECPVCGEKVTG